MQERSKHPGRESRFYFVFILFLPPTSTTPPPTVAEEEGEAEGGRREFAIYFIWTNSYSLTVCRNDAHDRNDEQQQHGWKTRSKKLMFAHQCLRKECQSFVRVLMLFFGLFSFSRNTSRTRPRAPVQQVRDGQSVTFCFIISLSVLARRDS